MLDALVEKVELPLYVAVIRCVPTARFVALLFSAPVSVSVATPVVLTVAVPFTTFPSLNVTVPEGRTVPEPWRTVAVSTTFRPAAAPVLRAGFCDDVSVVVVATITGGATTITLVGADVLEANVALPAYTAVNEWVPGVRVLAGTVNVADPVEFTVPVPKVVAPSLNAMPPLGTGTDAATAAVSTTL